MGEMNERLVEMENEFMDVFKICMASIPNKKNRDIGAVKIEAMQKAIPMIILQTLVKGKDNGKRTSNKGKTRTK